MRKDIYCGGIKAVGNVGGHLMDYLHGTLRNQWGLPVSGSHIVLMAPL